jgi:phosphonatase-like hydrolase
MSDIQLVVFDMAGTTVKDRDNVHIALMNAMLKGGYEVSRKEANDVMGYPKPYAILELLKVKEPDQSKINDDLVDQLHQHFLAEMLDFYENDPSVEPVEDAEFVFKALHDAGIKIGLDTGFSKDIAETIVKRLGWLENGLIDTLVASDEVPAGRPEPFMIHKIMEMNGIKDVKNVVKVGDTISDLLEGKNTGCKYTIGITTGAYKKEELEPYYHTHLVSHLTEILPIILG